VNKSRRRAAGPEAVAVPPGDGLPPSCAPPPDRPRLFREHVTRGEDERVLFTHGLAALVNYRQPVRVHVLRESNVCVVLTHGVAERAEIFRHRLRAAREKSVGRRVDLDDFRAECFEQSRRDRKRIEMRFAHLKRILRLGRLRLRGPCGAQDEFVLAAIAQNLRRLAKLVAGPPRAIQHAA